jgi:TRAP-type C4-dicarboxylate transport system substrate-binding protein
MVGVHPFKEFLKKEVKMILRHLKSLLGVCAVMISLALLVGVSPGWAAPQNPPAAGKPLILKASIFHPAGITYARANCWILDEIEKRSKGRLKIEYYWSGSLLPAKETVAGLKTGVADLAIVTGAYETGKLPLLTITSLPMTGTRFYSSAMAIADLMLMPEFKAELDRYNVRYISFYQNSSYGLWANKSVHTIADLKGKKIRAVAEQATLMKELGAVPVSMVVTETYTALQRGTVDGSLANPIFAFDYKFFEVCPHYYSMMFGNVGYILGVNKDSWNKVPSDIQQMFTDLREEAAKIGHEIYETAGERNLEQAQAKGTIMIVNPSDEDLAQVRQVASKTVWKDWVEKMNKKGLPGQKVLDNYLKYLEKWEARSPFKKPIYVK